MFIMTAQIESALPLLWIENRVIGLKIERDLSASIKANLIGDKLLQLEFRSPLGIIAMQFWR